MSVWSGLAAAGVAITLALVAFGQPVWEYQRVDSVSRETWDYRPFSAGQTLYNNTTGVTTFRNYTYDQLAGLPSGRAQPHMAKVFADYQSFMTLALIAGAAGIALGIVSKWRKLRGIFAGIAFLAAAAPILYTIFTIAFAIPDAATSDVSSNIREFSGSIRGSVSEVWGQRIGWYLPMGSGLAFAWASSDLWHVRPARKPVQTKIEVTLKPASSQSPALPPPPVEVATVAPPEPVIEEVFVIGSNGLLIKHMSRTLMTDKDRDVVGSMISAISSFVREAFSERDGEVHEVTLGDHRFV